MHDDGPYTIRTGDSRIELKTLPEASIAAIITDPPYGLVSIQKRFGKEGSAPCKPGKDGSFARLSKGFLNQKWDGTGIEKDPEFWGECLRVLRPGAYLAAFGGTRTQYRMACAIEDAGFEIRDGFCWLHGSGFPKSRRTEAEINRIGGPQEAIQAWDGYGTSLKPAWEIILLAKKPIEGSSIAANVLARGAGAMNLGACRIDADDQAALDEDRENFRGRTDNGIFNACKEIIPSMDPGRWPPNVLLSHSEACDEACDPDCPVAELERQSKGASRFFPCFRYTPKPAASEKDAGIPASMTQIKHRVNPGGLEHDPRWGPRPAKNPHPTVKPVDLLRWLVRLLTPPDPGAIVLDPFCGSGSTGVAAMREGIRFLGIEGEESYAAVARARVEEARIGGRQLDLAGIVDKREALDYPQREEAPRNSGQLAFAEVE